MRALLISILIFLAPLTEASEEAGIVILSLGNTVAISANGATRELQRGAKIFSGDRIETGDGRLQIRFTDESMLSLQKGSIFEVAQYNFDDAAPNDGNVVMELIKGGMRTISGKVGKVEKDDYRLKASVATIGIRGTHYSVNICDATCASTKDATEGVTGQVIDGAIQVSTDSTQKLISKEEYFFADALTGDVQISAEPPLAFDVQARANTNITTKKVDEKLAELADKGATIFEKLTAQEYYELFADEVDLSVEEYQEILDNGYTVNEQTGVTTTLGTAAVTPSQTNQTSTSGSGTSSGSSSTPQVIIQFGF